MKQRKKRIGWSWWSSDDWEGNASRPIERDRNRSVHAGAAADQASGFEISARIRQVLWFLSTGRSPHTGPVVRGTPTSVSPATGGIARSGKFGIRVDAPPPPVDSESDGPFSRANRLIDPDEIPLLNFTDCFRNSCGSGFADRDAARQPSREADGNLPIKSSDVELTHTVPPCGPSLPSDPTT